jgi:DNA polymerase-1
MAAEPALQRMYVVDAHSLIFQVFHAIRDRMTSPKGLPTNALFGFTRDLLYLRQRKPDYLLCAFDRDEPTFRSEIYADYKAHREPPPPDLVTQVPLIQGMLAPLGIPVLSMAGYEADDVMATLARAASARNIEVILASSDKDLRQLISDKVRLYNLRKKAEYGAAELYEEWGVTPEQVVDLQALVGDSVDNVPGVKGIGYKTAAKLLQEFGSLDKLLASLDRVKGKNRELLASAGETLALSRKLVKLAEDVPLEMDWEGWKLQPLDVPKLLSLCQEYGFRALAEQVRRAAGEKVSAKAVPVASTGQGELFPVEAGEELFPFGANATEGDNVSQEGEIVRPTGDWQADYQLIDTPTKFEAFLKELKHQKRFAFDLETTDVRPLLAEIVGIGVSWEEGKAFYLALRGPASCATLNPTKTLAALKPIFEDESRAKVNQNIKFDVLVLRANGIEVGGIAGDSMVADYLLHSGERGHNMEELARRYLNHQVVTITELIGKKSRKTPQLRMDQVETAKVAYYCGEDADVAWRLCNILEPQLAHTGKQERTLKHLYDTVEVPLIEVLAELEYNGIRVDTDLLSKLNGEMAEQLTTIEKEIYTLAGHEFNIGSLVQLRKVLFDELKLPVQQKTRTTGVASTDQETLEKLAALDHPNAALPRKILEYRQVDKLKSTYVEALPGMVVPRTGRIHASFNQTVAATGRLSASDPNLQNIPVRREQGQQIRQAFLPEEGWSLLMADYSQIELRLLAHFCNDEELGKAFAEDKDIHSMVAAQIFEVPEAEVTGEQRRMAKTVNFGVIYGMSAAGLSARLRIPRDDAEAFIDAYFARYPRVLEYQDRLLKECRRTGYVGTVLGRRRRIEGIRPDTSYHQRNSPEREAINMEIQGSAADLIKLAMLSLFRKLREGKYRSRMLLQIHDELVFEVPPKEMDEVAALVHREMTTPLEKELGLKVPLKVDMAAGPNWLDGEPLE